VPLKWRTGASRGAGGVQRRPRWTRARWSVRLLADTMVQLGYVESVSHETVRQTLKTSFSLWKQDHWVIPPEQNAEFVYR